MNNPMSGISGAYQLISSVEIKTEVVNLRTTYTEEIFLYVSEQNSLNLCKLDVHVVFVFMPFTLFVLYRSRSVH